MNLLTLANQISQPKFFLSLIVATGPIAIILLLRLLKNMLDNQLDEQLRKIIPLKIIRERISIQLKWFKPKKDRKP